MANFEAYRHVISSSIHKLFTSKEYSNNKNKKCEIIIKKNSVTLLVAPDTFNIVDISAQSGGLNNDQRRNLGSVAKILQFVATKKGV